MCVRFFSRICPHEYCDFALPRLFSTKDLAESRFRAYSLASLKHSVFRRNREPMGVMGVF